MKEVSILNRLHNWIYSMENSDKFGYMHLHCTNCGIKGKKKEGVKYITVEENYPNSLIDGCNVTKDEYVGRRIKITNCRQTGFVFQNCIQGSIHAICTPLIPDYKNGDRGVWIMGSGSKVKLEWNEFEFVAQENSIITTKNKPIQYGNTTEISKKFKRTNPVKQFKRTKK